MRFGRLSHRATNLPQASLKKQKEVQKQRTSIIYQQTDSKGEKLEKRIIAKGLHFSNSHYSCWVKSLGQVVEGKSQGQVFGLVSYGSPAVKD